MSNIIRILLPAVPSERPSVATDVHALAIRVVVWPVAKCSGRNTRSDFPTYARAASAREVWDVEIVVPRVGFAATSKKVPHGTSAILARCVKNKNNVPAGTFERSFANAASGLLTRKSSEHRVPFGTQVRERLPGLRMPPLDPLDPTAGTASRSRYRKTYQSVPLGTLCRSHRKERELGSWATSGSPRRIAHALNRAG